MAWQSDFFILPACTRHFTGTHPQPRLKTRTLQLLPFQ